MKKILRPFYLLYQLIAYPLAGIATMLTGIIISLFGKYIPVKGGDYYPAVLWSKFMIRIFLLPIKVEGRENLDPNKNYVFIANHQGAWDVFVMFGYLGRNFKWMMKDSLRKMPFIGKACYDTGHIFVNRSSPQKEIFVKALKTLKRGTAMGIFAEGTRTRNGRLGAFKKGAFVIADMAQLPVVPLAIEGSYNLLPKKGIFMNWTPLKLTIMKPIEPIGKGKENVEYLTNESRAAIAKALGEE
ncbi:MAG: 1-acyl-sn-glycerol-3-phosphate acyltransferase [Bacteroidaceae bacterium]|nr:1-acyl-sn-glycerol-3-phosphate acyltransferase [Bacteroidaceae bacterium]MBQ8736007.1 1-acyl-sn-glycerol-3-phosphate acyltransferase [Bacteroidaceae bacterium]